MNVCTLVRGSLCLLFLYFPVSVAGLQAASAEDSVQYAYHAYLEDIVMELEPEDADQLIEILESLREVPVDINTASRSVLETIPFLSESEINRIITIRDERGGFNTVEDLYSPGDIDRERIHLLMNFIVIGEPEITKRRFIQNTSLRSHVSSELQRRRGYREGQYLGSPVSTHHSIRAGFSPSVHGGMLVAKSAGERSVVERSSGYLSLGLSDDKITITAGDYRLHFGQGLLLSSGFGIAKSGNPARGVFRRPGRIRPAASRSEHYRFRGGAVSLLLPATEAMFFYSRTSRAATVLDDGSVRTMMTYPVYRTITDQEKKNALTETLFGAHIRRSFYRNASAGLTWYSLRYNREFIPVLPARFSGTRNDHAGIDWSVNYRNVHVFGEIGTQLSDVHPAFITGVMLTVTRGLDAALVYRSYPESYTSMYGFPFSERRGPADDEKGIYLGMRYRPAPRHLIEGYFDVYAFSNNERTPGFPVNGSDLIMRIEYPVGEVSVIDARVRRRSRPVPVISIIDDTEERILTDRVQTNIRINFITTPHRSFRFRMQHERVLVSYPPGNEEGSGAYVAADVRWNIRQNFRINARYLLYGTDSFDSRLYTSEYDMPGRVRTVLLNGQGSALSFGCQYSVSNNFDLSIKYHELFRSDGVFIGTGFQEVNGPLLGIVMLQIDAGF